MSNLNFYEGKAVDKMSRKELLAALRETWESQQMALKRNIRAIEVLCGRKIGSGQK